MKYVCNVIIYLIYFVFLFCVNLYLFKNFVLYYVNDMLIENCKYLYYLLKLEIKKGKSIYGLFYVNCYV